MANELLPLGSGTLSGSGKKRKGGKRGSGKLSRARRSLAKRFAAFKAHDLGKLAIFGAEVGGASALASAAKAYFGEKIYLWDKVDARLLAGAAALGVGQFGIPGVMKRPSFGGDLVNVGVGTLLSWLNDHAYEAGAALKPVDTAATAAPPAAEITDAAPAQGLVHVGNLADQVGMSERRKERIERRLERKLGKLRKTADKADIDWKDVASEVREQYAPARPALAYGPGVRRPLPPAPFLRPRVWAARHPRAAAVWAARHPVLARRYGLR